MVFSLFSEYFFEGIHFFVYNFDSYLKSLVVFLFVDEFDPLVFELFFVSVIFFYHLGFGVLELVFGPFEVVFQFEFATVYLENFLFQVLDLAGFVVVSLSVNGFEQQAVSLGKMLLK